MNELHPIWDSRRANTLHCYENDPAFLGSVSRFENSAPRPTRPGGSLIRTPWSSGLTLPHIFERRSS